MAQEEGATLCEFCGQIAVRSRVEQLTFHQWTDRGDVLCDITIPVATCWNCGARSWDEAAEAMIEQAVRRERDRLA